MKAYVTASSATAPSSMPGRSSRRPRGSEVSRTSRAAAGSATATTGTFSRNTARQPSHCTSAPPSSGPARRASLSA
jgi:hypothetical protein